MGTMKPDAVPTAWMGAENFVRRELDPGRGFMPMFDPRLIVEIGVDYGYSLYQWFKLFPRARIIGVDPYGQHAEAWAGPGGAKAKRQVENWVSQNPRVELWIKTSAEASRHFAGLEGGQVDLLHIDGKHDYQSVRDDFKAWRPHVREGGIVLFHDTVSHKDTVGRFFNELEGEKKNIEACYGLGFLRCRTLDQI